MGGWRDHAQQRLGRGAGDDPRVGGGASTPLQDHLELRSQREQRLPKVIDADQVARGSVETGHTRALTTVFGEVTVTRLAYRRRGHANPYPADAQLNLPAEKHSHGLRRLAAVEAASKGRQPRVGSARGLRLPVITNQEAGC